jgi:hypothetical protein
MPAVAMTVQQPADGTRLVGSGALRLTAALATPAPVPLFFTWYASGADAPLGHALDLPAATLPLGSHVLSCAAKDTPLDTPAALQAVVHAGLAGGPAETGQPCRVHVLIAALLAPAAGATLSRAGATLDAQAPLAWGRPRTPPATGFDYNPEYAKIDQLRWRWRFTPQGLPAGRASAVFKPEPAELRYVPPHADSATTPPVAALRYSGALPAGLDTGAYLLTLRVELASDASVGHEQTVPVVLT